MNQFVEYLNSTNNVGGNAAGSLAESQVKSEYFDRVKIDRRLGHYITDTVKEHSYHTFILTGHAGDGKTSVLVQVLKELHLIEAGEGLLPIKEYSDFFYVKDMSEIADDQQTTILEQALTAPERNKSSLLISNTGPLLNTFLRLAENIRKQQGKEFSKDERIDLQSKLLSQLDTNTDEEITVEGYKFFLVNIARVDNVSFSSAILKKIVSQDLWEECQNCPAADRCPVYNNFICVNTQLERVDHFIESYYRFLYENDKRMTIRQMAGQIGYAITGNLTCNDILNNYLKEPFFNYNFANLFFGFVGLNEVSDSSQIKGISQIKLLSLDQKALDVDYKLFVKNDFKSFFVPKIADELYGLKKKYQKYYRISDEENAHRVTERGKEVKFRRAIRRFYLVYSTDLNEEGVFNQIFGSNYTLYEKLVSDKQSKSVLRNVQTLVFRALYIKNTGFLPNGTNELPLTLRRESNVFQNVMLVLGTVPKNDLNIIQESVTNRFEDIDSKQEVYLKVNDEKFLLTLPMLTYFDNLVQGSISSNSNPALTHGIAKLDTLLLDEFGDELPESVDDCELKLLINTTSGQNIRCFAFDGTNLSILS